MNNKRQVKTIISSLLTGLIVGVCGVVILTKPFNTPKDISSEVSNNTESPAVDVLKEGVSVPVLSDISIEAGQIVELGNSKVNTGRYNLVYRFYEVDECTNYSPVLVYETKEVEAGSTEEVMFSKQFGVGEHKVKVLVIPYTVEDSVKNDSIAEYNINLAISN